MGALGGYGGGSEVGASLDDFIAEANSLARAADGARAPREPYAFALGTERIRALRRPGLTLGDKLLGGAIVMLGVAIAAILLVGGAFWGQAAEETPAPAANEGPVPSASGGAGAIPAPEPVVRSLRPDEATVAPVDGGARPLRPQRAKKPAKRARSGE